jgi:hypothetical protein
MVGIHRGDVAGQIPTGHSWPLTPLTRAADL